MGDLYREERGEILFLGLGGGTPRYGVKERKRREE